MDDEIGYIMFFAYKNNKEWKMIIKNVSDVYVCICWIMCIACVQWASRMIGGGEIW